MKTTKSFQVLSFCLLLSLSIICLLPLLIIISGSLTKEEYIIKYGYSLIPGKLSFDAYKAVFYYPERIFKAYAVTGFVTLAGTSAGLFIIAMTGYVLQRKDLRYRNQLSFFIYFTTLFSGGLIPWYIVITRFLHLKDSIWVLVLPCLMSPFLIILMKNFISSVPISIVESAKMDGPGDFKIFTALILPLIKPALATVGLFLALQFWNDWYMSSIFIETPSKYSLQYYLYTVLNSSEFLKSAAASHVPSDFNIPGESVKLATAVVATGPVILFYPFVQKYFVQGITIGAVKG